MATHYIDNMNSSPYYFNANNAATSQSSRNYSSSGYSSYPTGGGLAGSYLSSQSNRYENSSPQHYQSVAGFNRNTTQQRYQTPQSPAPQVRASVRIVGSQDQYSLPSNAQPVRVSPQQHHFQFDSQQQPGRPTGPAVVYQTPGAAQYTHHNVDLWTEGPSQGQDHYAQVQTFIDPLILCSTCSPRPNVFQFVLFLQVHLNNLIQFLLNGLKIICNNTTVN